MTDHNQKAPRGFAAMSPERRREVARKGGKRAQEMGTANRFDSERASKAGSVAGKVIAARGEMAALGRKGGLKAAENRKLRASPTVSAEGFEAVVQSGSQGRVGDEDPKAGIDGASLSS